MESKVNALQIKKPGDYLEAWRRLTSRTFGYPSVVNYKAACKVWSYFGHNTRNNIFGPLNRGVRLDE